MPRVDLILIALMALTVRALDNGLALTPPLAFNTWNYYGCDSERGIDQLMLSIKHGTAMAMAPTAVGTVTPPLPDHTALCHCLCLSRRGRDQEHRGQAGRAGAAGRGLRAPQHRRWAANMRPSRRRRRAGMPGDRAAPQRGARPAIPRAPRSPFLCADCWHLRVRSAGGDLQADPSKFPSGMAALAEHVQSKGACVERARGGGAAPLRREAGRGPGRVPCPTPHCQRRHGNIPASTATTPPPPF
jgi:hypothetical protein